MDTIIAAALIGGLFGIFGALVTGAIGRSKNRAEIIKIKADTNLIVTDTVIQLIAPLKERIACLEIELQDWKRCADARAEQLRIHNINPAPFRSSKKPCADIT